MIDRIDRGCSSYENTGTRLEEEFIGSINKRKYKEEAYNYLHSKDKPLSEDPGEKFEQILQRREAAQMEFEKALDLIKQGNYINYKDSMDLVEKCQIGNPEKPTQFFSAALYNKIKDAFSEKYTLKFFTSTGVTHLDVLHGVDCFFKLYEDGKEMTLATIDLTGNRDKDKSRADVLIQIKQAERDKYDPSKNNKNFNKEFFYNQIENFSQLITQAMLDNYNQKNSN